LAARHLLEGRGIPARSASAYEALRSLAALDGLPAGLRRAASRLTERVTDAFVLPHEQDPLADARGVIAAAFGKGDSEK
jgi:hypothetical protein